MVLNTLDGDTLWTHRPCGRAECSWQDLPELEEDGDFSRAHSRALRTVQVALRRVCQRCLQRQYGGSWRPQLKSVRRVDSPDPHSHPTDCGRHSGSCEITAIDF